MKETTRVWIGIAAAFVLLVTGLAYPAQSQTASQPPSHAAVPADQVKFEPIQVPGFDPGLKIAAIHGDPNAESGFYVIRLAFPAGYKFPPHWHPNAENLTVLEGEFMLGMGDTVDASKQTTCQAHSCTFPARCRISVG